MVLCAAMSKEAIDEACDKAGGQEKLAKHLGVEQGNIFHWKKKGLMPPKHVLKTEKLTGVERFRLNHKYYPRE